MIVVTVRVVAIFHRRSNIPYSLAQEILKDHPQIITGESCKLLHIFSVSTFVAGKE